MYLIDPAGCWIIIYNSTSLSTMNTTLCRKVIHMFATAEGLLTQQDLLNSDGLQEVFATNLFGHFILV